MRREMSKRPWSGTLVRILTLWTRNFRWIIRSGREHTPKDQYCADRGVFVIENLCSLREVVDAGGGFTAHTYPMNYAEMTGLPCRVVAEL